MQRVQLSERSRITPNYLGRIETEKVDPSLSIVLALAQALRVAVGELVDPQPSHDAGKRQPRAHLSPEALEIAAVFDKLPLDIRETFTPALHALARRIGPRSINRARRASR